MRACGLEGRVVTFVGPFGPYQAFQTADGEEWYPLTNSGDCADMNAGRINTIWLDGAVLAESFETDEFGFALFLELANFADHNNDPLAAWRYASTVVAGMMGEKR